MGQQPCAHSGLDRQRIPTSLKSRDGAKLFPKRRAGTVRAPFWSPYLFVPVLVLLCLVLATDLRADTISGTVKDPSGAVVQGARVELTGGSLAQPIVLTSDESGRFSAPDLKPGQYSERFTKDGFEQVVTTVDLH